MKNNLWKKIKWCWRFTKDDMSLVFVSVVLSLMLSYVNTLEPLYTGSLIDYLISSDFHSFIFTLIRLFLFQGLGILLSMCVGRITLSINKRSTLRGEKIFFTSLIKRENYDWIQGRKAEMLNTLQNDISVVLGIWTNLIPSIFASFFTLFIVSYRLFSINLVAFILTLLLSILPFFIHHIAGKKELALNKTGKKCNDNYVLSFQDSIEYCYEGTSQCQTFFLNSFLKRIKDSFQITYKKFYLSQIYRTVLFFVNIVTESAFYFFLGYGIYTGKNSVGVFMVAILYSQQIRALIKNYGSIYQSILAKSVSIDRVKGVLEFHNNSYLQLSSSKDFSISIRDLSFGYGNLEVFKDYNLDICGSGLYLIKGKNGCGKTTLLKILAGMTPKECIKKGEITILGVESEEDIAYIPSAPYIASLTIKDNLLLGQTKSDEEIMKIIEKVGLSEWFKTLPNGLDTIFDYKTMGLSQGQKVRFSLASNLLRERKIYLIDEIEDGIDSESRTLVMSILSELSNTKIVVVVSHSNLFDNVARSVISFK